MCQRLYIASLKAIASIERSTAAPHLEIWPATKQDERVRRHFSPQEFPHFYVAGAHSPCGCGFPEALPNGRMRFREEPGERATMASLVEALRPAVSSRPRVQLYLCFIGHEAEEPSGGRSVGLRQLQDPTFRFRDREVLTVFKGA